MIRAGLFAAAILFSAPPAWAQAELTSQAREAFTLARDICERDAGALWGVSLCGPMILADPQTRAVVGNQADAQGRLIEEDGVFSGTLPADALLANTAVDWAGTRWTMLSAPLPADQQARASLIAHESWHRIQDQLGLPMSSPTPAHLATVEGRVAMRMEWRALAAALSAPDAQAMRDAIEDALIFRAARRVQAGEPGGEQERALEMNEGLAEYTGLKLSGSVDPHRDAAAALRAAEAVESFPRMFAYASGPAYGLLLDDAAPGWRAGLSAGADLGALLAEAIGLDLPQDPVAAFARAASAYDGQAVADAEIAAQTERSQTDGRWLDRLVDGPVFRLPLQSMRISFDPNTLTPLAAHGTVYPTATITDVWGSLIVTEGALIAEDWSAVTVAAPADGQALQGQGWTLELSDGWRVAPGERDGDFVLAPTN